MAGISSQLFRIVARRPGWLVTGAVALVYGWIAMHGPQGVQALMEKHREIRQLEEDNAEKAHENDLLRERITRLGDSTTEQEMEIRKQLKLLRPGETTFLLPDPPKTAEPAK